MINRNLLAKIREPILSVLPICTIVLLLHVTIAPLPLGTLALFLVGTTLFIVGMGLFTLGAEMAMMPMGEMMGARLTEMRRLWPIISVCFLIGVIVTVAEPDLQVLAKQVPALPDAALVGSVAIGVGIFLVLALLRILFQVRLAITLIVLYGLTFAIAAFTSADYLAVAFDSGGVSTGPVTVPFILALGAGVAAVRGGRRSHEDSFGLCAICSIGPILAVLIIGIFYDPSIRAYAYESTAVVHSLSDLIRVFLEGLPLFAGEVAAALFPVVAFFGIFQVTSLRLPRRQLITIGIGVIYTFFGLVLLLAGVNIGSIPAATYLGHEIAMTTYNWVLIPLSALIGFVIVAAEPAVHVLNRQVEETTGGTIPRRVMMIGLSVGSALALTLAMIRAMTGVSIWFFLIPGYVLSLILVFFAPNIFVAIAFDSGGVAAGTMAGTFLLPFVKGTCDALGGNAMTDAFGVIALIAMMPLITVQIIGVIYRLKAEAADKALADEIRRRVGREEMEIIDL